MFLSLVRPDRISSPITNTAAVTRWCVLLNGLPNVSIPYPALRTLAPQAADPPLPGWSNRTRRGRDCAIRGRRAIPALRLRPEAPLPPCRLRGGGRSLARARLIRGQLPHGPAPRTSMVGWRG